MKPLFALTDLECLFRGTKVLTAAGSFEQLKQQHDKQKTTTKTKVAAAVEASKQQLNCNKVCTFEKKRRAKSSKVR